MPQEQIDRTGIHETEFYETIQRDAFEKSTISIEEYFIFVRKDPAYKYTKNKLDNAFGIINKYRDEIRYIMLLGALYTILYGFTYLF